jgi:amino acid transporter
MTGTKKGAFVVGLMTWLSCLVLIALCVYLIFQAGITLGSFIVPPGSSIVDILGIPLIQGMIDQILPLLSGIGGFDLSSLLTLLTPLLIWFFTPVIVVIVAAIVGAVVRPKEDF